MIFNCSKSQKSLKTHEWERCGYLHLFSMNWGKKIFPYIGNLWKLVFYTWELRDPWGTPCISHMMKYALGWELNGKKTPILWEKYDYQFPRLSPYHGLCCIFLYYDKFMGKLMHLQYDDFG